MGRGAATETQPVGLASPRASSPSYAARVGAALNTSSGIARLAILGRALILDMDDTLISNRVHFDQAADELLGIFRRLDRIGRSGTELRDLQARVSKDLYPTLGPTPERWLTAARKTASLVCGRDLTPVEAAEVRRAAMIAMHNGDLLPGVEDALCACRAADVQMLLKTKGDPDKQCEKVREHGLERFFGERIWVVGSKDARSFRDAVEQYGLRSPVSLGDSVGSDIAPAREAGIDAIYLESEHRIPDYMLGADQSLPAGAMSAPSMPEAVQLLLDLQELSAARPS